MNKPQVSFSFDHNGKRMIVCFQTVGRELPNGKACSQYRDTKEVIFSESRYSFEELAFSFIRNGYVNFLPH